MKTCSITQVCLLILCSLFAVFGVALITAGVYLRQWDNQLLKLVDMVDSILMINTLYYILIAVGVVVFLVGFLGCCGAIKHHQCMLGVYIACLILLFAAEFVVGILVVIYQDKITTDLEKSLDDYLVSTPFYENDRYEPTEFGASMNYVQNKFKCCGVNGKRDYMNEVFMSTMTNIEGIPFPFTCCKLKNEVDDDDGDDDDDDDSDSGDDGENARNATKGNVLDWENCLGGIPEQMYDRGCIDPVSEQFNQGANIVLSIACGVTVIQIICMSLAIYLCYTSARC